jgi:GNAT superfamily N-acetyltransferase
VLDAASLLAAYDEQIRSSEHTALEPGLLAEQDGPIFRVSGRRRGFVSPSPDLGVDGDELDALIVRQRDFFAARGESVEWKTRGHDLPTSIPDRLLAAGFVPEPPETVVIGVAAEMAAEPVLPKDIQLRVVTEQDDFRRIAEMESEVWDTDLGWMVEDLMSRRSYCTILVAEAEGRVVSAAWLVVKKGTEFGGLWGGSTLAEWRGRGIYRALVARRAQLAVEVGVRYLQVDASDDSRPILERLGFVPVTTTTPYVWPPAA